ncbi:AAA family ATPase [Streptomyces sp. NPDC020422]|uniref:AAA family ATPase n=1 Tax=Streptomyces sp. NPDC020422 TaxID=3365074 RepID=UPI0037ACB8C6
MKLRRLTLMGVRSYTSPCTIDFTGRRLFAILGDTGVGKSTILEAIIFALYGTCSWSKGAEATYDLISRGAPSMHVALEFEVDGRVWNVRRVLYANRTNPKAVLEPLSEDAPSMRVDYKKAVTEAVTELTGMDRDGFVSTFMPRQGNFAVLLKATPAIRTGILRHLFGISTLEHVRQNAETRLERLEVQITQAIKAQAELGPDPRVAAAQGELDVERTRGVARSRRARLDALRAGQSQAVERQRRKNELDKAAWLLQERAVPDAGVALAALARTKSELDKAAAAKDVLERELGLRLDEAQAALDACAHAGDTLTSLHGAFAVLSHLPSRATGLTTLLQQLEDKQLQHVEHQQEHAQALHVLAEREQAKVALAEAAARNKGLADEARTRTEQIQDAVQDVLQEATAAASQLQSHHLALKTVEEQRHRSASLKDALEELSGALATARDDLATVERGEAAHTAGSGLVPGDACTVCARPLPDGFAPPSPLDSKALGQAKRTVTRRDKAVRDAVVAEAEASGQLKAAEAAAAKHRRAHLTATQRMQTALLQLRELADTVRPACSPVTATAVGALFEQTTAQALRLAQGEPANRRQVARVAGSLVQPLLDAESEARTALASAEAARAAAQAEHEAAKADIKRQRGRLQRESKWLDGFRLQYDTQLQALLADIAGLPPSVRPAQPCPGELPLPPDIASARDRAGRMLEELEKATQQRDETRQALAEHTESRQALDERRRRTVDTPTRNLVKRLERWADAVADAAGIVGDEASAALPSALDGTDLTAVASYRLSLASLDKKLAAQLQQEAQHARDDVLAFEKELAHQAAARGDAIDASPGFSVPSQGDLLERSVLDPLSRKTSHAEEAYDRAKADLHTAQSRIPYADALEAAIKAGKQQAEQWRSVRRLLTEGKFLTYLTEQRTHALLSHASRNLQEISSGNYVFTEKFEIVDCATRLVRHPETLSGGETFQASLALALALVELNSRSRGHRRLKTLFLDEGFGSLDAASLEQALFVLGHRTTPDTAIAVVSHMYPVADEVDDVLHVTKTATGSSAEWLSPEERTRIIHDGLQKMLHHI